MWLVINDLGGRHTHTYTNIHRQNDLKKPGVRAVGLVLKHAVKKTKPIIMLE